MEEELANSGVFRQADSAIVGVGGLASLPETLQEMGADGPVGLIMRDGLQGNRVQDSESCFGSFCFGDGCRVSRLRAERRRHAEQLFVEQDDGRPVGPAAGSAPGMHGLDGRFELKSSELAVLESLGQMKLRFFY